jgi:GT2 family glycosyltransferase
MPLKVSIVIASKGRPVELGRWVQHIDRQTVKPHVVIFSVPAAEDLPSDIGQDIKTIINGRSGSCLQRNAGLEIALPDADIVAFFDDDYVPSKFCVERIIEFFALFPNVAAANGIILADGINSPGIPYDTAQKIVDELDSSNAARDEKVHVVQTLSGLYGCNMAFRSVAIGAERFDENLPAYGWQEDIDFAARVGKRGAIVKTNAFWGVHQGVKGARTSGTRLGYSQIVNPLYLARKGTMQTGEALRLVVRTVLKNHARALRPEPWVDRRGRCKGNWRAIGDVMMGRADPSKILEM